MFELSLIILVITLIGTAARAAVNIIALIRALTPRPGSQLPD